MGLKVTKVLRWESTTRVCCFVRKQNDETGLVSEKNCCRVLLWCVLWDSGVELGREVGSGGLRGSDAGESNVGSPRAAQARSRHRRHVKSVAKLFIIVLLPNNPGSNNPGSNNSANQKGGRWDEVRCGYRTHSWKIRCSVLLLHPEISGLIDRFRLLAPLPGWGFQLVRAIQETTHPAGLNQPPLI